MSDDFFVFPEEEEAPEVRAAKLRLHKTLKRNRTREKEVLQPLPAAEKIFLSENVSELEQQNIQPQKTKMRHSSVENEKNISHNKEVNRKDSIDGENRSKRRKLKNESIQEKTSTNTMNADRIQDPYKKQTFYKNGKKNYKNDAVVKTSYTQNINLIDQLSKHLEKASHKDAQKNQIRELELKRNTNFNGNAKESINIIEEYKDEMGKTDGMVKNKTQQEIQIKQRTKGTGVHNQQNNKGFICTVPKNQLKDESLVDVVNIEEENKQQDNGGEDVITLDDVQDQISEEKNERIKDSDSAQNRNKRKERSIRNTSTRTEMEKMGERKNKKHTTTHRSQSLKRKTSDTTVNMKRSFRMSDHISTDKENDWETGTNSHNRTGKGNKKQVHQNNGKERDQTKGLQNDNKRRNLSIPIITINSNGSNSPITISSMTCSTSESSEVNYLNETQKNKENWKHKNQSIGDKNKKSENEDDIYQTTTYDKKRGTVPMSMAQLDNMVEESKTRKKGNVEVDARELMKNLKKHYNSLNKTEKLYYCYMMKKLKIKYDNKKNVFYNDGMFINNFSKKMKQDKTQWDHVSYMEYSIYYMLKWLTPTEEEKLIKLKALMKLEIIVKSIFTKAKMEVFGSFVTGLSIPGADVDVCFMNIEEDELNALYIIAYTLVKLNICHSFNILVHAQVKILRYIDKELGVRFDVCINQKSSRKTTDFIAKQVKKYVYLRPLVLLVKFFLSTRQLNETYSGGIGSFLISCMVLHFLQMHESAHNEKALHASTLTSLLLEFFNFYSFDYKLKEKCVVLRGMGHILPMYFRKELQDADRRLCFENPIDIDLNVGQKSFRIKFILYAFSYGLCTLISLLERLYSSNNKYSIANNPDTKNCHGGPTQIYGSRMYSPFNLLCIFLFPHHFSLSNGFLFLFSSAL